MFFPIHYLLFRIFTFNENQIEVNRSTSHFQFIWKLHDILQHNHPFYLFLIGFGLEIAFEIKHWIALVTTRNFTLKR